MLAEDPYCSVWQQEAGDAPAARQVGSADPWHLLQRLSDAAQLLQGALPSPAEWLDAPDLAAGEAAKQRCRQREWPVAPVCRRSQSFLPSLQQQHLGPSIRSGAA